MSHIYDETIYQQLVIFTRRQKMYEFLKMIPNRKRTFLKCTENVHFKVTGSNDDVMRWFHDSLRRLRYSPQAKSYEIVLIFLQNYRERTF